MEYKSTPVHPRKGRNLEQPHRPPQHLPVSSNNHSSNDKYVEMRILSGVIAENAKATVDVHVKAMSLVLCRRGHLIEAGRNSISARLGALFDE